MQQSIAEHSKEGDVFGVPLAAGGFALSVVARSGMLPNDGYGEVLCYFFGPRLHALPEVPPDLRPEDTVLIKVFSNHAIEDSTWPLLGSHPDFNREEWPTPDFSRRDDTNQKFYRVHLHPDDPSRTLNEWEITAGEAASLPTGGGVAFSAGRNSFLSLLLQEESLDPRYVGVIEARALDWPRVVREAQQQLREDPTLAQLHAEDPQSSSGDDQKTEHAVILSFPVTSSLEVGGVPLQALEDRLADAIDMHDAGEFDGDVLGPDDATLYMYGPDADRLFAAIRPVLKRVRFPIGSYVVKRYGDPGDPDVKETRVDLAV